LLIQLHGHVICNFKLHYSFQLHFKVLISNIYYFYIKHHIDLSYHRLNVSLSPVLTATSLSYEESKNSTHTESKPLTRLR